MNQGGLKHAATDSRLDNKRERRRGASGRAAALRRAPSDSDCSGETASLSADSGDRAVRPPPPPTRVAKSRSRRRGSEWEVLEGLKDGQRFEKRPDVFNGYLHKKRKWPLKGWHKRFFVVDGGILVYARSPTDVARGRLHGSVDVGLSVISAKARRRRIDIDADEFIYHLRAKTADVFRTWLNVLKAHRLYRQHLLTFGARESVPKIHAPLEDLPPTDTSSRTSRLSIETSALTSNEDFQKSVLSTTSSSQNPKIEYPAITPVNWHCNKERKLVFFNFQRKYNAIEKINEALHGTNRSMCSMNCLTKINLGVKKCNESQGSTNAEKQMLTTDLESTSLNTSSLKARSNSLKNLLPNKQVKEKLTLFRDKKADPATTYYFFSRKKRNSISMPASSPMRRSKKSTNLVKYKNIIDEPKLKEPLSKCLLLRKRKSRSPRKNATNMSNRGVVCDVITKEHNEVQVHEAKEHKSLQDLTTVSEYDKITEHLMITLFENHKITHNVNDKETKYYINQVVKELYDVKFSQTDVHPVKMLFRSLLEYWLKNTTGEQFKEALKRVKSVHKPSNEHFTQDKILSSLLLNNATKQTQFHGISDFKNDYEMSEQLRASFKTNMPKPKPEKRAIRCHSPKRDTESFEKERRIQELERVLKNTVYVCETARSNPSKEKDIRITKKLIDNLEKWSKKSELNNMAGENVLENSNSSSEIPMIQETINHLISETAIPPDVAKEFLSAYLGILLNESSKSVTQNSSESSERLKKPPPLCDVQAESVDKRASTNVTTVGLADSPIHISYTDGDQTSKPQKNNPDPGELYLKDVLDKITTVFSKVNSRKSEDNDKSTGDKNDDQKQQIDRSKEYPGKNLIHENYDDNTVVIDLSKYDLDHISMISDPKVKGVMSIGIKLKEKSPNFSETKGQKLSLKFCNESKDAERTPSDGWLHNLESQSLKKMFDPAEANLNNLHNFDPNAPNIAIELKPYVSSSESTPKAYCQIVHESEHSIDLSFKSSNFFRKEYVDESEDTHSCYIVSSLKKNVITTKLPPKKKVHLRHNNTLIVGPQLRSPNQSCSSRYPEEYSIFEQPTPKIIDEKFILLLLENLTLLSKNLPSLHKDINTLYLKLRKKHDKVVRNCGNIQGLSLLGRIYNDDLKPNDRYSQYEETDFNEANDTIDLPKTEETAASTSKNLVKKKSVTDRSLSTCELNALSKITEVQTENSSVAKIIATREVSKDDTLTTFSSCSVPCLQLLTAEKNTSAHFWYKEVTTENCGVSTMITALINNSENVRNPFIACSKHFANVQNLKTEKGLALAKISIQDKEQMRRELANEIALLTTGLKISTQSQTDEIFLHKSKDVNTVNEFPPCNEFKVYRLVLTKAPQKSNSMIDTLSIPEREKSDDLKTIYRCKSEPSYCSGLVSPTSPPLRGPQAGFVSGTPGGRLASWIIESGGPLENASRELGQAQLSVQQLQRLLEALELQQQVHHDTDVSLEGASPNVKKDRRKFGLRKKKSNSKCASVELAHHTHIDPSSSHMALSALTAPPSPGGGASSVPNSAASLPIACAAARPQSLPGAEALGASGGAAAGGPASLTSLTPDHQLREDFTVLAKDLVASLKGIVSTLVMERGRLRAAMEAAETTATPGGGMVAALRTNLTSALHQNSELRSRLSRIHDASDLAEISSVGNNSDPVNRQFQQSLSYSSSCVSASEFFDAEEHDDDLKPAEILAADEAGVIELDGDSSSEAGSLSSEEGSASSDNSDGAMLSAEQVTLRLNQNGIEPRPQSCWTRRTCLPCPRPTPGGPSLWNLLYKNIGKDLSQISMPVTINEPLNMLQRLCEELEYSELLDAAAACGSAAERMALVAAFAVSAYAASAHRAASKPFNPLLAETYECVRGDKGFRFLAEQVSHHPPISACHAESPRWCFWQEARIKTKFWGKSMEFQPTGRVHLRLLATGDHYSWNKVTTCVHNLFGGQRWVDQYGDMHIICHGTDISCKLQFIKASSWSSSRHEVRGAVTGGGDRLRLQGRWSEALYAGEPPAARCLWRPGAMPHSHELYYGFTRFAMELNELEPGMKELLPHTDTRLRPDQRALEEGDVEAAERHKLSLEQAQRERRRGSPEHEPAWFRKKVEDGEETWVFTGEYWKAREAGFSDDAAPRIW